MYLESAQHVMPRSLGMNFLPRTRVSDGFISFSADQTLEFNAFPHDHLVAENFTPLEAVTQSHCIRVQKILPFCSLPSFLALYFVCSCFTHSLRRVILRVESLHFISKTSIVTSWNRI